MFVYSFKCRHTLCSFHGAKQKRLIFKENEELKELIQNANKDVLIFCNFCNQKIIIEMKYTNCNFCTVITRNHWS